jgi:PhnB protein
MYVPPGYGTMFPYLFVRDASRYLDFLKNAFGAEELGRTETPDGTIANARFRLGTTSFMVSEAGERIAPSSSSFYLYVENADSAFERALSHGAQKISEPADMAYGDRQAGVTDPSGNIWWISQRVVHEPYDT